MENGILASSSEFFPGLLHTFLYIMEAARRKLASQCQFPSY